VGSTKDQIVRAPSYWVERCLRIAAAAVFVGMGLIGLLHDLPLRTLFWDQVWWGWAADSLGYCWKEWVTSSAVDTGITWLGNGLGGLFLLAGLWLLLPLRWHRNFVGAGVVKFAWFFLLIQYFLIWKEHFWQIGQVLEMGLQLGAYPLLVYYVKSSLPTFGVPSSSIALGARFWRVARLLISLTFVGHGLYAAGIHPVPANFVLMTQAGLGVGEPMARNLLMTVGALDFAAAALLLLPQRKAQLAALSWILPWAVLTTLARLWSYGGLVAWDTLLTQWAPEVIRRLPHVLVPFALLLSLWRVRLRVIGREDLE